VAQLVKHPTPGFGSGHDLMGCEMEPCIRESALSLSTSAPSPLSFSLSQVNKSLKKELKN